MEETNITKHDFPGSNIGRTTGTALIALQSLHNIRRLSANSKFYPFLPTTGTACTACSTACIVQLGFRVEQQAFLESVARNPGQEIRKGHWKVGVLDVNRFLRCDHDTLCQIFQSEPSEATNWKNDRNISGQLNGMPMNFRVLHDKVTG